MLRGLLLLVILLVIQGIIRLDTTRIILLFASTSRGLFYPSAMRGDFIIHLDMPRLFSSTLREVFNTVLVVAGNIDCFSSL